MKAGWQTKPVDELLMPQTTINPSSAPDRTFSYIDVSSVSTKTFAIEATQNLLGKDAPSRARKLVRTNDVIFATIRPTLKRVALIPDEFDGQVCSTGYVVLRPTSALNPGYLFYWLFTKGFSEQMVALQRGASYPAVSDGDVRRQPISFPERTEQERIAAILDEAFEGITTAETNAERIVRSTSALFERALDEAFSSHNSCWSRVRLGDVCSIAAKLIDPREDKYQDLIHIGAGNIESRSGRLSNLQTASQEGLISGKFLFEVDSVLYSKIRPYLRKVVRPDFVGICSADIYPLLPNKKILTRDFLYYLLLSANFTRYAIAGSARAGMPKVNRDYLFEYEVLVPPVSSQKQITSKLESIEIASRTLDDVQQRKIIALSELKKSLLHQAFSGSL